MEEFLTTETLIIELVLVATLVAVVVGRIRLPYTVALVLVGLFISFQHALEFQVTPALILALFIPPILFEAAFHLDIRLLRANLAAILTLAVPGVVATALLVGVLVALGTDLPFTAAIVFGAAIAPTDPVAVISLFRTLGVPRRLAVALEGESLFNDGTAIVVFGITVGIAVSGTFDAVGAVADFFEVALGGMMVGIGLGWLTAQLIARIDEPLIVTSLTTLLAFGSYVVGEELHVSGVLSVVMAGIFASNLDTPRISPPTKFMLFNMWEYLAFLANSLVFLLIGLEVDLPQLADNLYPIAVAVGAVLLSRAVVLYGLSWLIETLVGRGQIPHKWRHVLFWGGLRGAISLALALGLPMAIAERGQLQAMTFGVLLFTLLVQGTTIRLLLRRLGLVERAGFREQHERHLGRYIATQAGLRRLRELHHEGLLTDDLWAALRDDYRDMQRLLQRELGDLFVERPELERETLLESRRKALEAERAALGDSARQGLLAEDIYTELRHDVDRRLDAIEMILAEVQE
jgi:CPA1 family monovalent cation:H+ antiporter